MTQPTNDPFDIGDVICLVLLLPLLGIFFVGGSLYVTGVFIVEFLGKKAKETVKKKESPTPKNDKVWRGYNTSITDLLNEK